jgi:NAD(P)-dependent dehydrogenase (short-subunit alcohol dehydrogenase family)
VSAYQAAKWAVGGFTEVLAREVGHLGIKVTALEPGGMQTNWANRATTDVPPLDPDYVASVGAIIQMLERYRGNATGDPKKVAEVVVKLAAHASPPAHLLLGSDAVHFAGQADADREASGKLWQSVSVATDFAASGPLPELPAARPGNPTQWMFESFAGVGRE